MLTAIVLAREDIREYDQRIFLYTKERGLLVTRATGVKKIISKQSSRLEPGTFIHAEIVRASGGDKLVSAEPIAFYPQIRRSYRKGLVIQYVLGLVATTVFLGQPDRALFDFLRLFMSFTSRIPEYAVNTLFVRALWRYMAVIGFESDGIASSPRGAAPRNDMKAWHQFAEHHLERCIAAPPSYVFI